MDGRLGRAIADTEQAVRRALPRPIHAGIERAKRLDPSARKRQPQERPRQPAQQMPEGDVRLAHCDRHDSERL